MQKATEEPGGTADAETKIDSATTAGLVSPDRVKGGRGDLLLISLQIPESDSMGAPHALRFVIVKLLAIQTVTRSELSFRRDPTDGIGRIGNRRQRGKSIRQNRSSFYGE